MIGCGGRYVALAEGGLEIRAKQIHNLPYGIIAIDPESLGSLRDQRIGRGDADKSKKHDAERERSHDGWCL